MPYFDYAATTPLDAEVFEKMRPYFTQTFGNSSSVHSFGRMAQRALDESREIVAATVNAQPSEVYFTCGGTEADNWAIQGAGKCLGADKRRILVGATEHPAVLKAAESLERVGFVIQKIQPDVNGIISAAAVSEVLGEDVGLVSIMYANNETGTKNSIMDIARLCRSKGIMFHTDAVQAAATEPLDLREMGADLVSVSAHKFYGPKGAGFLYIRKGLAIAPLFCGGSQERGLRGGTVNVPNAVGLAQAFAAVRKDINCSTRLGSLRDYFESLVLAKISGVAVNGADRIPSISNITIDNIENSALLAALDLKGIAISAGSACTAGSLTPSHVLLAMGRSEKQALSSVRFSFGRGNTLQEIDLTVDILRDTVEKLRNI